MTLPFLVAVINLAVVTLIAAGVVESRNRTQP